MLGLIRVFRAQFIELHRFDLFKTRLQFTFPLFYVINGHYIQIDLMVSHTARNFAKSSGLKKGQIL